MYWSLKGIQESESQSASDKAEQGKKKVNWETSGEDEKIRVFLLISFFFLFPFILSLHKPLLAFYANVHKVLAKSSATPPPFHVGQTTQIQTI